MSEMTLPEFCRRPILVLGCGNRLFGDDGFGPAVIDHLLANYRIPDDVYVMDVGTGARKLLLTISLSDERPRLIILVDAVDKGKVPGELFELCPEDLPPEKIDDVSVHQAPSSNLASELRKSGVDVRAMACQVGRIPEVVDPGLSVRVKGAVPRMSTTIMKEIECIRSVS